MVIQLYRSDENLLLPKEVASRLVQHLPTVKVDWARGNEMVEESLQRLLRLGAPEPIITSHKGFFDNTAHIELSLPEYPGKVAVVVVEAYKSPFVECDDPEAVGFLMDLANRLSRILGYQFITHDE